MYVTPAQIKNILRVPEYLYTMYSELLKRCGTQKAPCGGMACHSRAASRWIFVLPSFDKPCGLVIGTYYITRVLTGRLCSARSEILHLMVVWMSNEIWRKIEHWRDDFLIGVQVRTYIALIHCGGIV